MSPPRPDDTVCPADTAESGLLPLVNCQADRLHDEIFSEVTYHAAYEPMRAVRTNRWKYIRRLHDHPHPIMANVDDCITKTVLVEAGWAEQVLPREELYDLTFDPAEARNVADRPENAETLADLRGRLDDWMARTADPLLEGPLPRAEEAMSNSWQDPSPKLPQRPAAAIHTDLIS